MINQWFVSFTDARLTVYESRSQTFDANEMRSQTHDVLWSVLCLVCRVQIQLL